MAGASAVVAVQFFALLCFARVTDTAVTGSMRTSPFECDLRHYLLQCRSSFKSNEERSLTIFEKETNNNLAVSSNTSKSNECICTSINSSFASCIPDNDSHNDIIMRVIISLEVEQTKVYGCSKSSVESISSEGSGDLLSVTNLGPDIIGVQGQMSSSPFQCQSKHEVHCGGVFDNNLASIRIHNRTSGDIFAEYNATSGKLNCTCQARTSFARCAIDPYDHYNVTLIMLVTVPDGEIRKYDCQVIPVRTENWTEQNYSIQVTNEKSNIAQGCTTVQTGLTIVAVLLGIVLFGIFIFCGVKVWAKHAKYEGVRTEDTPAPGQRT